MRSSKPQIYNITTEQIKADYAKSFISKLLILIRHIANEIGCNLINKRVETDTDERTNTLKVIYDIMLDRDSACLRQF